MKYATDHAFLTALVLKGGFALELRLGSIARSTKDADFEWRLAEEEAVEMLLDAAALDLEDRFTFALERADEETDLPGGGQRWRVTATLAGRVFERAVIDVAFAAAPVHAPDEIATSTVLEFADIAGVPVDVVIANTSTVDAPRLSEAINVIFDRRAEHDVPTALPAAVAGSNTVGVRSADGSSAGVSAVDPPRQLEHVLGLLLEDDRRDRGGD